jgi:hypothetical protein
LVYKFSQRNVASHFTHVFSATRDTSVFYVSQEEFIACVKYIHKNTGCSCAMLVLSVRDGIDVTESLISNISSAVRWKSSRNGEKTGSVLKHFCSNVEKPKKIFALICCSLSDGKVYNLHNKII